MRSFPAHLYDSFTRINGWVIGVLGLILSIAFLFFGPDTKVIVGWLVAIIAVAALTLAVSIDAAYVGWRASRRGLPKVRRTLDPPPNYTGIQRLLLLDPSDLFGVDALVSIYVVEDDEYERLLAIGRVLTVQENGYLQVGIVLRSGVEDDLTDRLTTNDAIHLSKLLVKPSVPSYIMQELQNV